MPFPYPWQGVKDPLAIPSGAMRSQVEIQQQAPTPDSAGQPQAAWTTMWTTPAAISTLSMREVYQTAQFAAQVTHRITVRWPGNSIAIVGGQRVAFGSRIFQVQTVENVQERNRVLHLLCLEINGAR